MEFRFKTEPYAHQMAGFDKLKDLPFSALFGDMGTGKSKMILDIAAYKYCKGEIDGILVIAPNHVHSQWVNEQIPTHLSVPYKAVIWNSAKHNNNAYTNMLEDLLTPKMQCLKVFAINVEAYQTDTVVSPTAIYVKNNRILTIVDEATRIKTPTAKRSKTIHKLNKYGQRIIATGTPVTKSPFGLWSMFEFLKANFFDTNFFIFQRRHGIMMRGINNKTGRSYDTLIDEKMWNIIKSSLRKRLEDKKANYILEHLDELEESQLSEITDNMTLDEDDYEAIAQSFGVSEKNVKFIETREDFTKYKRLDEIKQAIEPYTFSVRKEDCLDLPPKVYENMFVDMNDEQSKVYKDLKERLLAQYGDKELTVANKVALTTRMMQICGGFFPYKEIYDRELKEYVPYVVGMEEDMELPDGMKFLYRNGGELIGKTNVKIEALKADLEEAGTPIILWAQFVAELTYLYESLKKDYKCCLYYGATSSSDRERILHEFKAGQYDIFIGNPSTAAYGLNLQNATLQYYYSNSFRVEDRLQAEDRSHRIGVKRTCVYKDIIANGTIDEKITLAIKAGRSLNDFFTTSSLADLL